MPNIRKKTHPITHIHFGCIDARTSAILNVLFKRLFYERVMQSMKQLNVCKGHPRSKDLFY